MASSERANSCRGEALSCGSNREYHVHDGVVGEVEETLLQRLLHGGHQPVDGAALRGEQGGDLRRGQDDARVAELGEDCGSDAFGVGEEGQQSSAAGDPERLDEQRQQPAELVVLLSRVRGRGQSTVRGSPSRPPGAAPPRPLAGRSRAAAATPPEKQPPP